MCHHGNSLCGSFWTNSQLSCSLAPEQTICYSWPAVCGDWGHTCSGTAWGQEWGDRGPAAPVPGKQWWRNQMLHPVWEVHVWCLWGVCMVHEVCVCKCQKLHHMTITWFVVASHVTSCDLTWPVAPPTFLEFHREWWLARCINLYTRSGRLRSLAREHNSL